MKSGLAGVSLLSVLVSTILGSAMVGCATTVRVDDGGAALTRDEARSVVIRRGDGTGIVSWDEVASDMADADVVLFGEMHGHRLGLAVAQELWEDILVQSPGAVLSMEFYERDQQLAVDDYLTGVTDREGFEKAAKRTPGNNPRGHARMIDAAKEAGRPVLAANSPRRYVSISRKEGYEKLEGLGDAQRAMFEIPVKEKMGAYRDRFFALMDGMALHGGEEIIKGFYRSQSLWDATMGDSVIDGLSHGSPVAHVVGYFHVSYGGEEGGSGLIDEIRSQGRTKLGRELKVVTLITLARDDQDIFLGTEPVLDDEGEEIEEGEDSDLGIADYVVYVGAPSD